MPVTDEPEAEVSRLWQESRGEYRTSRVNLAEPAGVDLVTMVDGRLGGCIHTWLYCCASFGARHLDTVRVVLRDLERLLPEITDEGNLRIGQHCHRLAQLISDSSPDSDNGDSL
ncbi:hypothetical protein ACFU7Y_43315 [Kitasatospora sp. NPDC057542]|uniref:hypothetical protein n=1 Tax=Streptomycetaceae TaxID=2062 RepID=UPI001CCC310C|nr:hypothetical protein [Streptomyces sp. LS1784]